MNTVHLVKAVLAIMVSGGLFKFGNQNYEALKADGGVMLPILCLVGGIVLALYGLRSFGKAFSNG